jgi:hypothetical protein
MIKKKHSTSIELGNNFLTPNVIGRNSLTELDCIAEIVANSLDWRITKIKPEEATKILIKISEDYVHIIDNGVGMTFEELDTAIDLGESGNDIREKLDDEERKGMYGLGMKVAALSLGWKLTINSVSIKDPQTELKFEFDSRKLQDKKSNYLKELSITEESRITNSPLKNYESGTSVLIEDLVKEVNSAAALGKDLEERFSPDINSLVDQGKLELTIQSEDGFRYSIKKVNISAKFEDDVLKLDFDAPSQWAKREEYTYIGSDGKKYRLRGFIQLLKERSVTGQSFGLNLYCKGQLIERFHKDKEGLFTIAGRSGEKTYGELHLDGCFPDNVKANGFIRDKAFYEIRNLISEDLELYKYLSPASGIANQRVQDEINKRKGLGSANSKKPSPASGDPKPDNSDTDDPTPKPPTRLSSMPEGTIMITERLFIQVHKTWVHENALNKKRNVSWEHFYRKSNSHSDLFELQVYINPESSLYKGILALYGNKSDQNKILSFFKKMAVCQCINEQLISDHGYNTEDARDITDQIVYPSVLKMDLD